MLTVTVTSPVANVPDGVGVIPSSSSSVLTAKVRIEPTCTLMSASALSSAWTGWGGMKVRELMMSADEKKTRATKAILNL